MKLKRKEREVIEEMTAACILCGEPECALFVGAHMATTHVCERLCELCSMRTWPEIEEKLGRALHRERCTDATCYPAGLRTDLMPSK